MEQAVDEIKNAPFAESAFGILAGFHRKRASRTYALTEEKEAKKQNPKTYKVEKMRFSKTKNIKKSGGKTKQVENRRTEAKLFTTPLSPLQIFQKKPINTKSMENLQ